MKYWNKLNRGEITARVFSALNQTANFDNEEILGIPASHLDKEVFYSDAPFLKEAPFLSTLIRNPNHIGCHTTGCSESFFSGTQQIERELIEICAQNILGADENSCDGYVASGGTEANIQAIWIYRNYFQSEFHSKNEEICIICSTDSHYSMAKAANLLGIKIQYVQVDEATRLISKANVEAAFDEAYEKGAKYFIVVANMMTTMFGSVDPIHLYLDALHERNLPFKAHVDGAFGGFFYPFTDAPNKLDFSIPEVDSVTLDAHKMVQAPYGTGVFIVRKGLICYANTKEASYVEGEDMTLIGSRSGANAVAIWMILMTYGAFGWDEKITTLLKRTSWLEKQVIELGLRYYRNPFSNIITLSSDGISEDIAMRFGLVPDNHHNPQWYKIVVMEHVTLEKLVHFIKELQSQKISA